jgi:DMSO/TMAO reductase YedYZ molybdopterin-dependent catalytic subunit
MLAAPALAWAQQKPSSTTPIPRAPGLVIRQKEPVNLESPFHTLDSFLTPSELFYVRCHFPVPQIAAASHQLRVEGAVNNAFNLSYDELRRLPSRTLPATLECAGNSRVFLVPQTKGAQWELGAVSTAEWTGVPLSAILERAGVRSDAVEVVLEGADQGEVRDEPKPAGKISFSRSLPLAKARQPEVLLAYQMNGKDLTPEHGFPVRAVVPGYFGMSSVKWLTSIKVVTEPFQGYWQTTTYAYWDHKGSQPVHRPLRDLMVKSEIARPSMHESVSAGQPYRLVGAAWTGNSEITRVEISTDGGRTWADARLLDPARRFAWRRWEYEWRVPAQPGKVTLMSRATDAAGNVQTDKPDPNYENYGIHHTLPIEVLVS